MPVVECLSGCCWWSALPRGARACTKDWGVSEPVAVCLPSGVHPPIITITSAFFADAGGVYQPEGHQLRQPRGVQVHRCAGGPGVLLLLRLPRAHSSMARCRAAARRAMCEGMLSAADPAKVHLNPASSLCCCRQQILQRGLASQPLRGQAGR